MVDGHLVWRRTIRPLAGADVGTIFRGKFLLAYFNTLCGPMKNQIRYISQMSSFS